MKHALTLFFLAASALAAPVPQSSYATYGDYSDVTVPPVENPPAPAGGYGSYGDYSDVTVPPVENPPAPAGGYGSYGSYPAPAGGYGSYGTYKRDGEDVVKKAVAAAEEAVKA